MHIVVVACIIIIIFTAKCNNNLTRYLMYMYNDIFNINSQMTKKIYRNIIIIILVITEHINI